jgi:hypothetical protein
MIKKLSIFSLALFTLFNLSAQTYKVGDLYDVNGKRGVVFELSEDGKHGAIIALTQPKGIMPWAKAMAWGKELKDGWYIPSHKELLTLLGVRDAVNDKLQEVGERLTMHSSYFYWSTTEFDRYCVWVVCMATGSSGGSYKENDFNVRAVSKF